MELSKLSAVMPSIEITFNQRYLKFKWFITHHPYMLKIDEATTSRSFTKTKKLLCTTRLFRHLLLWSLVSGNRVTKLWGFLHDVVNKIYLCKWIINVLISILNLHLNFDCYGLVSDGKMPRKKPFSNKQKKKQLHEKREKRRVKNLGTF